DFDLDGALDLYVANDGVANHLWMPRGGAFSDEALLRGAALNRDGHAEAGMGVDAGDVDNDGDEDIFLTHLTQETNTLYLNLGNATFDDATSVRGLGAPSWEGTGFGTGFLDFDLDGWLDLVVLNGAVKVIEEQRGEDHPLHQLNQLYRNRGGGHFEEIDGGDAFAPSAVSRGVAIGDVDNDGDSDLVILNNAGPARLLLGDAADRGRFLGLRLLGAADGPAAHRDMLGAWVELRRPDGPTLHRRARTGGGYVSAHDPRVRVGLGPGDASSAAPITLHITWPDGARERFEVTAINRYLTLRQGDGRAVAGDSP
ncbi:MAG: CRTAC1 family protein, partial [Acidobacteriota bacterium]